MTDHRRTAAEAVGLLPRLQNRLCSHRRLHELGSALVPLAAIGTDKMQDFLKEDALQIGILIVGLIILFGAKSRDWNRAVTIVGIALLGLAVVGLSSKAVAIGTFLGGWIWT